MDTNKKEIKDFNLLTQVVGNSDNILVQRDNGTTFRIHINNLPFTSDINNLYSTAGYLESEITHIKNNVYPTLYALDAEIIALQSSSGRLENDIINLQSSAGFLENNLIILNNYTYPSINALENRTTALESTAGRLENDINNLQLNWNVITNTPTTLSGYGITDGGASGATIVDTTISQLQATQASNGLTPLNYYKISDSQYGGFIYLKAITNNQLETTGIWETLTNLKGFGSLTYYYTGGGTDAILNITLNDVNLLTSIIQFNNDIPTTLSQAATNINNNSSSGVTAININNTIILVENASTSSTYNINSYASGSIGLYNILNITNGKNPEKIFLDITYYLNNDYILSCNDKINNILVTMDLSRFDDDEQSSINTIKNFRWGDDSYVSCNFINSYIDSIYVQNQWSLKDCNFISSYIHNIYTSTDIQYLIVKDNSEFSNCNILNSSINDFILRYSFFGNSSILGSNFYDIEITKNSEFYDNKFFNVNAGSLTLSNDSEFASNIISYSSLYDIILESESTFSNNTLNNNSYVQFVELNRSSTFGYNIIDNNSGIDFSLLDFGSVINNLNINNESTLSEIKLISINSVLSNCSFNNSIFVKITVSKNYVTISNINLPSNILSSVSDIEWSDFGIKYNILKSGINGGDSNGLVDTDMILAPIFAANYYPTTAMLDFSLLTCDNTAGMVAIGFDDNYSAINTNTLFSDLSNTTINGTITYTKTSTNTQYIRIKPTIGSITSGSIKMVIVFIEGYS